MASPQMVMYEEEFAQVQAVTDRLVQDANARVVFVVDKNGQLISSLDRETLMDMVASGAVHGGMIPKVEAAVAALFGGVSKVHIVDGRVEHAVLLEIFTQTGIGTEVLP